MAAEAADVPRRPPSTSAASAPLLHVPSLALGAAAGALACAAVARAWRRRSGAGGDSDCARRRGTYATLARQRQVATHLAPGAATAAALAAARQEKAVARAVTLRRSGDYARAGVELAKAIEDNAVCRHAVLPSTASREEALGLYRMHLQRAEHPQDYGRLLQLRGMLAIPADAAEEAEMGVLEQGGCWSI